MPSKLISLNTFIWERVNEVSEWEMLAISPLRAYWRLHHGQRWLHRLLDSVETGPQVGNDLWLGLGTRKTLRFPYIAFLRYVTLWSLSCANGKVGPQPLHPLLVLIIRLSSLRSLRYTCDFEKLKLLPHALPVDRLVGNVSPFRLLLSCLRRK